MSMPHRRTAEEIRAEIRGSAVTQFLRRGYEATTLEDVARAMDLTRPGILYHYGSKEALLRSIVDPAFHTLEAALDALPQAPATTAEERRHVLAALVGALCEHRDVFALVLRFPNEHGVLNKATDIQHLNTRAAHLLVGDEFERDLTARIRVVTCLAALSGTMGARLSAPLDTDERRAVLVDGLAAILDR